jgi:serine/threonine-protein phosphatase 2A regulatory subunit A
MMDTLVADDIPNIRFNVAKSYAVLINVLKRLPNNGTTIAILEKEAAPKENADLPISSAGVALVREKILPNLEKLQQDDDVDVRYFATTAAQGFEGVDDDGEEMES